jgi:putative IMPACT (imprinted ancient) family translation regulator
LRVLPRAEKAATEDVMLAFPYTYIQRVRELVAAQGGTLLEEDFGADVTVVARFRVEKTAHFAEDIKNLTRGTVETIIIMRNPNTILTVENQGGHSIHK